MHTTSTNFPLRAVLIEHPSSKRRVQISRRFHFGLAAMRRQRQQHTMHRVRPADVRIEQRLARRQPLPAILLSRGLFKS